MLIGAIVINAPRGEGLDFRWKQMCKIRTFDMFRDLRLGLFSRMNYQRLAFDQRPFNSFFRTIYFEAFTILSCGVKKRTVYMCSQIGIPESDVSTLDSKGRVIILMKFLINRT